MKVIDFFKDNHLELRGKTLVIATSAGPDSMALVDMLNKEKQYYDYRILVAHFDHQLRQDSSKETSVLKKYCQKRNLPFFNGKWEKQNQPAQGLEAAARLARYQFLTQIVKENNGDYLLTAHHGDDLVENILLKFIRSGNPEEMNSLQEIGTMNGVKLVRPLLSYTKDELLTYDQNHQIDYVEDETNKADDTMRNRLRHHVVPFLKQENAKLTQNALRYCRDMMRLKGLANDNFKDITPQKFLQHAYRLQVSDLADFTENEKLYFWQNFIWQTWHERVNQNLSDYSLVVYQGYYYLSKNFIPAKTNPFKIKVDRIFTYQDRSFLLSKRKLDNILVGDFWSDGVNFAAGSLMQTKLPLKNGHHVKSKKKFAQAGIPDYLRSTCLTIYVNKIPIFVEKTYQSQLKSDRFQHYYIYNIE